MSYRYQCFARPTYSVDELKAFEKPWPMQCQTENGKSGRSLPVHISPPRLSARPDSVVLARQGKRHFIDGDFERPLILLNCPEENKKNTEKRVSTGVLRLPTIRSWSKRILERAVELL